MSSLLTLSYGDHPEIMEAILRILMEAGAVLEIETVQLGEEMKKLGFEKGFDQDVLRKIRCSQTLLKGVNLEVETKDLCLALGIKPAPESIDAALAYRAESYAIFEPATADVMSVLSAAVLMLKHLSQIDAVERIEKALSMVNALEQNEPDQFAELIIAKLY